jgi:hypothetical protein
MSTARVTFFRNISDPTLTVFEPVPGTANHSGIIVVPGGAITGAG